MASRSRKHWLWIWSAGKTCRDEINCVSADLFRTLGGIEDKCGNNAVALVKFNNQIFSAVDTKQAIVIVTVICALLPEILLTQPLMKKWSEGIRGKLVSKQSDHFQ